MIGESVSKNKLVYGQLFGPLQLTLYGDLGLSFFQLLSPNSDAAGPLIHPRTGAAERPRNWGRSITQRSTQSETRCNAIASAEHMWVVTICPDVGHP
jgi:hypothetical protein